jgi:hypothetical protein
MRIVMYKCMTYNMYSKAKMYLCEFNLPRMTHESHKAKEKQNITQYVLDTTTHKETQIA